MTKVVWVHEAYSRHILFRRQAVQNVSNINCIAIIIIIGNSFTRRRTDVREEKIGGNKMVPFGFQ